MAPEMIQRKAYDRSIDTWALGVLLYELIHGKAPFEGGNKDEVKRSQHFKKIKYKDNISVACRDLI